MFFQLFLIATNIHTSKSKAVFKEKNAKIILKIREEKTKHAVPFPFQLQLESRGGTKLRCQTAASGTLART